MRRALLVLLVAVIALPAATLAVAHFVLTPDWLKARAEEAVQRATGRELTIAGPVQLGWSLSPTVVAQDVSLANPPGMSRPAMAHLDRVEAQVALLPLLSRRVEVRRLVLTGPDVRLERDVAGRPNWAFAPPPAAPSAAPAAAPSGLRMTVALGAVTLRDGRLDWPTGAALVPELDYAPDTRAIGGRIVFNGVPIALNGTAGPVAGADWPLDLKLVGGGAAATIAGTASRAAVSVLAPDLAAVSALAGRPLPDLHDVSASAVLSSAGIADLRLSAGAAEFGAVRVLRASLLAPGRGQPVTSSADLRLGQLPVAASVNAGSLDELLGSGPIKLQVMLATGDATISAEGSVADLRGNGLQLALSGHIPDLQRLGALADVAVPPLHDVSLEARVAAVPPGWAMRGLRLTSSGGDLAGDLTFGVAARPFLRGTLVSQRLVLDSWLPTPLPHPAAAQVAAPPAPPAPAPNRVIPDTKLPLPALRRADADLRLSVGEAVWRGVSYRAAEATLHLDNGSLRLDPVTLQGPGGPMRAQLAAQADPPSLAVSLQAPGLAAGPVLAMFGAPEFSSGTVDLTLDLRGQGDSLRQLAATLDGHAGFAMVDGAVDNRWLEGLLGEALRTANVPLEAGGRTTVRCAAIRADAAAGQVRLQALTLDTSRLKLDGDGVLNLANETLDLHLRPQLRMGTLLSVPVRVTGMLRAPKAALDPGALQPGRVGLIIGGAAGPDTCGPALAAARDGRPGPVPAAPEPAGKAPKAADLLRSLLR